MEDYKKKQVKQKTSPKGKTINQGGNPENYYSLKSSWIFNSTDRAVWTFSKDNTGNLFWEEILPKLQGLESQTWGEILVNNKKENHSIEVNNLSKKARKRLTQCYIEAESIISLRLTGTHRLYGYISGNSFTILWFDKNHGDNDECVCRSHKKHT